MTYHFLKNFVVFFVGSAVVSIINYLFYPVVGRMLQVSQFGELQVLIAIITQIGLVLGALSTVITQAIAANADSIDTDDQLVALESLVITAVLPMLAVGVVLIPFLESYLKFKDFPAFLVLMSCVYVSVIATFNTATMQGFQQFKHLSVLGVILSVGKLLLAVLFIQLGLGVFGGISALLVSGILGYKYSSLKTERKRGALLKNWANICNSYFISLPLLKYGFHALVALSSIAILFTSDLLIVKHYFSSEVAGQYAVVSTVAKIAYFALLPMSVVLLPTFSFKKTGHFGVMLLSGAIMLFMTTVGLITVYLIHDQIILLLFGSKYLTFSYLLPKLTLAMALLAILQSVCTFALAQRSKVISVIFPLGPLVFITLNLLRHATVDVIVINLLISIAVQSTLLVGHYIARAIKGRYV